jgi:DNA-binding NarL/FixJ family response regulator
MPSDQADAALTPREWAVAMLVNAGLTDEIAERPGRA